MAENAPSHPLPRFMKPMTLALPFTGAARGSWPLGDAGTNTAVDAADAAARTAAADKLRGARDVERRHELIALVGRALTLNYSNYNRFRACSCRPPSSPPTATHARGAAHAPGCAHASSPTMVMSFLGDTEVGKSTTIRALMGDAEDRPFVQRGIASSSAATGMETVAAAAPSQGWMQTNSTTFNVNLYPCRALLPGSVVNFLDFEGENGSEAPVMSAGDGGSSSGGGTSGYMRATAHVLGISAMAATAASPLVRAESVREFFPRLAYCSSDVVVLIGTEPFYSTRYLERALSFAKRANMGVQDVELPVLLLISNKRDADETETNIETTTRLFQSRMGADLALLDSYFSCIVCCQLPNVKTSRMLPDGSMQTGAAMFEEQILKIKTLLVSLLKARILERETRLTQGGGPGRRIITSRMGLWFALLPKIVDCLNSDEPIFVSRLVDEAWSASMSNILSDEAPMDVFKALTCHGRPPVSLSLAAPRLYDDILQRFSEFCAVVCSMSVRFIAARLRCMDASFLFEDRVEAAARPQLEVVLKLLHDLVPCIAVYAGRTCGRAVDRPDEPVLCMQEARSHAKSHRGSRCVRGGGSSLWSRLLALTPYNPTWEGKHEPAHVALPSVRSLLEDVLELVFASPEDYTAYLLRLQHMHSTPRTSIVFVQQGVGAAVCEAARARAWPCGVGDSATSDGIVAAAWTWNLIPAPTGNDVDDDVSSGDTGSPFSYCAHCGVREGTTSQDGTAPQVGAAAPSGMHIPEQVVPTGYVAWLRAAVDEVIATVGIGRSDTSLAAERSTVAGASFAVHTCTRRRVRMHDVHVRFADTAGSTAGEGAASAVPQHAILLSVCSPCASRMREFNAAAHAGVDR